MGSVLQGWGLFGLVSGLIVLGSGIMLRIKPEQSAVFGLLMLIFSVPTSSVRRVCHRGDTWHSGGVMTLRWKRLPPLAEGDID